LWRRFVFLFRREQRREELEEEIRLHQALRTEANRESGLSAEEAIAATRRTFGNSSVAEEESQDAWGTRWLDALKQDLRFALRTLRRTPGFTGSAVLTLAIGVGATTAMFAVLNGVLLHPLPVRQQEQLVVMWSRIEPRAPVIFLSATAHLQRCAIDSTRLMDWRRANSTASGPYLLRSAT